MTGMALTFLKALAVFVPLERLFPHRGAQPIFRPGWLTDVLCFFVNGALFTALLKLWLLAVPDAAWLKPVSFDLGLAQAPLIVQILATILTGSLVYYWGHRLLHAWRPLWRFHAVHHSIENMDWLATYRGHLFETVYFTTLTSIVFIVVQMPQPAGLAFLIYRFFEGQIEHSNVRVPLGPLKWVLPSPWYHHWHHSTEAVAQNRNFSPYPIWDVLFGTAYMPSDRLPEKLGVDEPVPPDYIGQFFFPFGLGDWATQAQARIRGLLQRG